MMTYSTLISAYEWITAVFITVVSVCAVLKNAVHAKALFYGILIFDTALVMDRLLPLHEPIMTGWFVELAGFALILSLGIVIGQEVAAQYRETAVLTERANRVESENEMLDRLNRMKTEFLGNVSHELKTPLAVISSHAQLTRQHEQENPPQDDYVTNKMLLISSEAERTAALVEQLLEITRIEEGRLSLISMYAAQQQSTPQSQTSG